MFDVLVASVVPPQRSPLQVVGAVAIHAVLLLAAILVTRSAALAGPTPDPGLVPPDVYINRVRSAPVRAPAGVTRTSPPPRPEFPSAVPLAGVDLQHLPTRLPSTDVDPSASAGGAPAVPDAVAPGSPDGVSTLQRNDEVDQPARRVYVVRPVYPSALRAAGVEGTVRLSFIIDTTGGVEPGSVTVLAASHPGFVASASAAVRAQRFIPAERRGVVVRTLAEQTVRFAMGGRGSDAQP